jgi:hypothetical protein
MSYVALVIDPPAVDSPTLSRDTCLRLMDIKSFAEEFGLCLREALWIACVML